MAKGNMTTWTAERVEKFHKTLATTGNVSEACRCINISRTSAYERRKVDKSFAEIWDDAMEAAGDRLESVAVARAVDGWQEPVFFKGKPTSTVHRFDNRLLTFLLRGAKPEKYRERSDINTNIRGGADVKLYHVDNRRGAGDDPKTKG